MHYLGGPVGIFTGGARDLTHIVDRCMLPKMLVELRNVWVGCWA